MNRRRALSASVMSGGGGTYDEIFGDIPPESKTFKFPLYITVPFSSETSTSAFFDYEKDNDDIVKQLHAYCIENAEMDYTDSIFELWVVRNIPDIYINGKKVKDIQIDAFVGVFEPPRLFLDEMSFATVYECFIHDNGYIFVSIYK